MSTYMSPQEIRRLAFYLDGLRYSMAMAHLSAERLVETLDELARSHRATEPTEKYVTMALLDAWTLIDMCHRTRELVQQMPGLSQKLPGVQIFLRGTAFAEGLRHYVQHFRSGIPSIPKTWSPLWGAISWVPTHEPLVCYTIFTGNILDGLTAPSISFDTHGGRFTASIMLFAGTEAANLLVIADHLRRLRICILDWIDQHPIITRQEGQTLIWRFSLVPVEHG